MTIIKEFELGYIDKQIFYYHLAGSGQQLINEEGLTRFIFYIEAAGDYHKNEYYIIPFISDNSADCICC
ncbi:hypothetical protein [Enterococcus pallens]|uniref:Uncharacterized protein n=1 Tax=Enterococcus pallens ATCC BAA-351 TaxID=1158607 RepID=R2PSR5_9ENTE|nr:hypothetical protein [Enterococcus pallens]EOH86343.1 hypothetical protein UAU_05265 [Enterococcus pallens ATCC BAA-351]EOU09436.1 hypothetical protein I588_05169 [Enterococcus pallens ATCC BAA-351]